MRRRRKARRRPSASRPWIPRVPRFRRANEIRGTIYKAGNCKRVLITIAKNIARFGSSERRVQRDFTRVICHARQWRHAIGRFRGRL